MATTAILKQFLDLVVLEIIDFLCYSGLSTLGNSHFQSSVIIYIIMTIII